MCIIDVMMDDCFTLSEAVDISNELNNYIMSSFRDAQLTKLKKMLKPYNFDSDEKYIWYLLDRLILHK